MKIHCLSYRWTIIGLAVLEKSINTNHKSWCMCGVADG
jgi:hypothetical protein